MFKKVGAQKSWRSYRGRKKTLRLYEHQLFGFQKIISKKH
jgi:hypothetical protein